MRVHPLFPSPLVEYHVSDKICCLLKRECEKEKYIENSDEGSCASVNIRVLSKLNLTINPNVEQEILKLFHTYAQDSLDYNGQFRVSTSWYTKVTNGGSSQYHHHKNSFYSGVLYFGQYHPEDEGFLYLLNPLEKYSDFFIKPNKSNPLNTHLTIIPPESNKIIFFPSYLSHKIGEFKGDVRYSLAFNIVPKGEYGDGDSSMRN